MSTPHAARCCAQRSRNAQERRGLLVPGCGNALAARVIESLVHKTLFDELERRYDG